MFREGISTLNIRSILREPLDFIYFSCYNFLAFLKEGIKVIKKKMNIFYLHFLLIWKDECPLPTYP